MDSFRILTEILGTIAFSASGALTALKKDMDAFGIIILGVITAVGGGIMRDVFLGITPPTAFVNKFYVLLAAAVAFVFVIPKFIRLTLGMATFDKTLFWLDAIGLGAFTVTGITVAMDTGHNGYFLPVLLGLMTGTGGGVLRDILAGDRPSIFVKEIYASASIAGGVLFGFLNRFIGEAAGGAATIGAIVLIRYLSMRFGWNLPHPMDHVGGTPE